VFRAPCAHHQEVKITLHSLWYHHTYRCDDTRGCVMQFWPTDDKHMCSKHVEAWNKLTVIFFASSWLITEISDYIIYSKSVFKVFYFIFAPKNFRENSDSMITDPHISLICDNTVTTTVSQKQCHNSKSVIFQEKYLKVLKCYNFLWVQRRQNCSPAASFANCVDTTPVKSASAYVSFYINNSKMPNFDLRHSCRK